MRDSEAHSSGGKSSSVAPAAGLGEEIPGEQKHNLVPPVRRPRCVHSVSRRSQCAKCAKGPNLPEQGVRLNQRNAWMASRGFTKFGHPVTGRHRTRNVGKESRCGHRNAPIVQDKFPNWIQGYPMKTKDTSERIVRLQRFLGLFSESRDKFSGKSRKLIQACQDLQWNHDKNTLSSLRNKRSGRHGHPQSETRDCCRTCTTVDTTFTTRWPIARHLIKNVMSKNLTDRSFLAEHFGCVPITAKDKSRTHQFGKKTLSG